MALHTMQELKMRQRLPLEVKIRMSQLRIREWIDEFGAEGVYISFSGGKDSTVLLHLVREVNPDIPAVFVDTGLEYPEVRAFAMSQENVDVIRPKLTFKQVIQTYGYPFISKDTSGAIEETRRFLQKVERERGIHIPQDKQLEFIKNAYENGDDFGYPNRLPIRALQMIGKVPHKEKGEYTGELSRMFNRQRYGFAMDCPVKISNKCCEMMKKRPFYEYAKKTGRHAHFTGMMAEESLQRQSAWLKFGCNAFESRHPTSNPMSFWTNQDVLNYIKINRIEIASVYGDVEIDYEALGQEKGQMTFSDILGIPETFPLKTSGCDRTGCMFCGYGCHLNNDQRFVQMKQTHPKQYDYIMRPASAGGLNYKEVIDWLNEHGNLNIKY